MANRRVPHTSLAFATVIAVVGVAPLLACSRAGNGAAKAQARKDAAQNLPRHPISDIPQIKQVVDSAIGQIGETFEYDPSYSKLGYPNGDVPLERGVCADVIVRAFRKAGVDLQKEIHEEMSQHFTDYPNKWGATGPDSNIDHRRVANLMTFFERRGKSVPITKVPSDYVPGDVVAWQLDTQPPAHRHCHGRAARRNAKLPDRSQHRRGSENRGRADVVQDNRSLQDVEINR